MISKKKVVILMAAVMIIGSAVGSFAMMMGGGSMMTTSGGFGMMDGLAGRPIVGADGTTYVTGMIPSSYPGTTPTSSSFTSHMTAITTSGQILKMTVSGLMSKPVINGSVLMGTVSLPKMSDYSMVANDGTTSQQSVFFWMQLPLSSSSVPKAVSMDGRYASEPVIANNQIHIVTTNYGSSMMQGNDVFNNTFPNYTAPSTAKSYLYILNMDGTMVSKTVIQ